MTRAQVLVRDENIDFQAQEAIEAESMLPVVGQEVGAPVVGQPIAEKVDEAPSAAPVTSTAIAAPPPPPPIAWLQNAVHCFCVPVGNKQ